MTDIKPNQHLYDAMQERAMVYLAIFNEMSSRYGEDEAIDVLRKSLNEHGRIFGESLKKQAPDSFKSLIDNFACAPDAGATFSPVVNHLNADTAEVRMMKCPLKDAWIAVGLNDKEVCTLLHCASAIDEGTLDAAGCNHEIQTWKPGEDGCCRLKITAKD